MWINKNLILELTDKVALRVRSLTNACLIIAGVLVIHSDLLHLPHPYDDWLLLACMVVMAFNHSVKE